MSKKNGQLSTHVSDEVETQIKALAAQEGISSSVYLSRLIDGHLGELKSECDRLSAIFYIDDQRSNRSIRSDSTE